MEWDVNASMFVVGNLAPKFLYSDKLRAGEVEKVTPTYVCMKVCENGDPGKVVFKSFNYEKMVMVEQA